MPPRIVVDSSIPYIAQGMPQGVDVRYLPSQAITPETVAQADALMIRSVTHCDERLLSGSSVRLITSATAGFDHIDTTYCHQAGIRWYNASGCNADSVAQYVLTSISYIALQEGLQPTDITLGIIGTGHTGGRIYQRATALGMRVLLYDPKLIDAFDAHSDWSEYLADLDKRGLPRPYLSEELKECRDSYVSLSELTRVANFITLHIPLTTGGDYPTYHLVNDLFLESLGAKPWIINACRGAVVDTDALICALDEHRISGAVIDCWEHEPQISLSLLHRVTIGTPHIAGFSVHGKSQGAIMSLSHLCRFFQLPNDRIALARPTELQDAIIDLAGVDSREVIWRAMLHTLDLSHIMYCLVDSPHSFEQQRVDYNHPYEPRDYIVRGVLDALRPQFTALGFTL